MDKQDLTIESYSNSFHRYLEKTHGAITGKHKRWMDQLISLLPAEAKIFEIGSGTGRDALYLRKRGMNIICSDVHEPAINFLDQHGFKTMWYDFREHTRHELHGRFDAVLANCVLLHTDLYGFTFALNEVNKLLKCGGYFGLVLKKGEGEEISLRKLGSPRYFKYYQEEEVIDILKEFKFLIVFIATEVKKDDTYIQLIARKSGF